MAGVVQQFGHLVSDHAVARHHDRAGSTDRQRHALDHFQVGRGADDDEDGDDRVEPVLDAWFDSGSMPAAQWHYPFENKEAFERGFPADFIGEGLDQTRGWFYSLLAISTLLFGADGAAALPAGAPIHLLQLNHRVTPALATGRRLVFLSAKRDGDRERRPLRAEPQGRPDQRREHEVRDRIRGRERDGAGSLSAAY